MNVLVLNCGSATVKFQVWSTNRDGVPLAGGVLEGRAVAEALAQASAAGVRIDAAGHRVVHGGERFGAPVRITSEVIQELEALQRLAPLHNPGNLEGIRAALQWFGPDLPQAAVFDTAFHATLPERALHYAVPLEWRERYGLRRYGFHGLSHRSVAERYAHLRGRDLSSLRLVTLHLGNGCSACAIEGGRSVDTSMGFTPLEGLMMGSRSGDLDPGALPYLAEHLNLSCAEVERQLNHASGLLGVSGRSHDMRVLLAHAPSDPRAALAIEMFCYRARKYAGAYLAALGGADALVFTGGIGEHSPQIRARICAGLEWFGLSLDVNANENAREGGIHTPSSRLEAWVIPTREEQVIASDTEACLGQEGVTV